MTTRVAILEGGFTDLSDDDVEAFRAAIRGRVGTDGPDLAGRQVFNAMHDARPALTVACSGTADVAEAVGFAAERGLAAAVRGGGHSIAGLSTVAGGLLIDLAPMAGVVADPVRRLAHAQGGALWADVDREAQAFGLATPGGVISHTGIGGLTLGGGYGWLRRKYGLSCDNVVEAQVVLADGSVHTASADSEPDLFWAIRGGGGNFGVVTAFTYRLQPAGPIVAFTGAFYAIEDVARVLEGWRSYCAGAPEEVSTTLVTITFPEDPDVPPPVRKRACAVSPPCTPATSTRGCAGCSRSGGLRRRSSTSRSRRRTPSCSPRSTG